MPSTTKVRDVLWRVSVLLNDSDPQFNLHTENELVALLEDAELAISTYAPSVVSRIDAIRFPAGSHQHIESIAAVDCKPSIGPAPSADVRGLQLLDVLCNMGTDGLQEGKSVRNVRRDVLDRLNAGWRRLTGDEVSEFIYDPLSSKHLFLVPGLKAPAWLLLNYVAMPTPIVNTGTLEAPRYAHIGGADDVVSVSDECREALVNYIAARVHMKEEQAAEVGKAQMFTNAFLAWLNAKVQSLTGTNPNLKALPLAPEPLARAK